MPDASRSPTGLVPHRTHPPKSPPSLHDPPREDPVPRPPHPRLVEPAPSHQHQSTQASAGGALALGPSPDPPAGTRSRPPLPPLAPDHTRPTRPSPPNLSTPPPREKARPAPPLTECATLPAGSLQFQTAVEKEPPTPEPRPPLGRSRPPESTTCSAAVDTVAGTHRRARPRPHSAPQRPPPDLTPRKRAPGQPAHRPLDRPTARPGPGRTRERPGSNPLQLHLPSSSHHHSSTPSSADPLQPFQKATNAERSKADRISHDPIEPGRCPRTAIQLSRNILRQMRAGAHIALIVSEYSHPLTHQNAPDSSRFSLPAWHLTACGK
jgi:hypothetical protein